MYKPPDYAELEQQCVGAGMNFVRGSCYVRDITATQGTYDQVKTQCTQFPNGHLAFITGQQLVTTLAAGVSYMSIVKTDI